jgi:hypothetical protein
VITPAPRLRHDTGRVRRGDMVNVNKIVDVATMAGDAAVDVGTSLFTSIANAFSKKVTDASDVLEMSLGSLPQNTATFETMPLVAHHNLTTEGLKATSDLGGIPMPSIAVSRADAPLENFGEITLVVDPKTLDPSKNKNMNVYPVDAFTGRQEKGRFFVSDKNAFIERLQADVNFEHMSKDELDRLNIMEIDDADLSLKRIQAAIDEGLVNPKDWSSFSALADEAYSKLEYDANNADVLNKFGGLAQYADLKRMLPPRDPYYSSGNRRPMKEYTPTSIMRDMRQGADGPSYLPATEYGSYGPGKFRASMTSPFGSLQEIQDARSQIFINDLDNPNPNAVNMMDDVKTEFGSLYFQLMNDLNKKYPKLKYMDGTRDFLQDVAKGVDPTKTWAKGQVPSEDMPAIKQALDSLSEVMRTAPTEYFEGKPNAFMKLEDFSEAIIPADASEETKKILRDAGLATSVYKDFGIGPYRKDIIRTGIGKGNLFSAPATGMLGYGALQSVGGEDGQGGS